MANLSLSLIKKLYYKERLSTLEIARRLKTTPWVVLGFMKRMDLPRRTLKETNKITFERKPKSFCLKQKLSGRDNYLKVAGSMLYWAEGAKYNPAMRSAVIDFVNSDPRMVKLFLSFLRIICGIDEKRLRVLLYCYANQDIEVLKKYWYKVTEINFKQFTKPYVREDFLPEKSGKMKYGLVHIRYHDKKLLIQIYNWINEYLENNSIRG